MSAQVFRVEDPRDMLEKATRDELVAFAHAMGQVDISERMMATDIRKILRDRGMTNINIHNRPLGGFITRDMYGLVGSPTPVVETQNPVAAFEVNGMTMGQLRAECKQRGIRMARTDNMETLRDKLRGQDPA